MFESLKNRNVLIALVLTALLSTTGGYALAGRMRAPKVLAADVFVVTKEDWGYSITKVKDLKTCITNVGQRFRANFLDVSTCIEGDSLAKAGAQTYYPGDALYYHYAEKDGVVTDVYSAFHDKTDCKAAAIRHAARCGRLS